MDLNHLIVTACKRSLRRLCFHRCLSVQADPPWAGTPLWAATALHRYTPPPVDGQQAGGPHPTGM